MIRTEIKEEKTLEIPLLSILFERGVISIASKPEKQIRMKNCLPKYNTTVNKIAKSNILLIRSSPGWGNIITIKTQVRKNI
jgi:hypothetical protein